METLTWAWVTGSVVACVPCGGGPEPWPVAGPGHCHSPWVTLEVWRAPCPAGQSWNLLLHCPGTPCVAHLSSTAAARGLCAFKSQDSQPCILPHCFMCLKTASVWGF